MKRPLKIAACITAASVLSAVAYFALILYLARFDDPATVDGIYVGYEARSSAYYEHGIDYCKLLEKALNKDDASIRKLALWHSRQSASAFMVHGSVLIDLIWRIGEDEFVSAVGPVNEMQQSILWSSFNGGMDYHRGVMRRLELDGKTAEEAFPKVYALTHGAGIPPEHSTGMISDHWFGMYSIDIVCGKLDEYSSMYIGYTIVIDRDSCTFEGLGYQTWFKNLCYAAERGDKLHIINLKSLCPDPEHDPGFDCKGFPDYSDIDTLAVLIRDKEKYYVKSRIVADKDRKDNKKLPIDKEGRRKAVREDGYVKQ